MTVDLADEIKAKLPAKARDVVVTSRIHWRLDHERRSGVDLAFYGIPVMVCDVSYWLWEYIGGGQAVWKKHNEVFECYPHVV